MLQKKRWEEAIDEANQKAKRKYIDMQQHQNTERLFPRRYFKVVNSLTVKQVIEKMLEM